MGSERRFYVYGWLRAQSSDNGPEGSYYYIGKGSGKRAYKKHDTPRVPKEPSNIVIIADGMSEVDALQAEMLLIHLYGRIDVGTGCLRNMPDGGDGVSGFKWPDSLRQSFREFRKTTPLSDKQLAHIRKVNSAKRGVPHSEEHRRKIGEANRRRIISDETRRKMSESKQALLSNPLHRQKLSEAATKSARRGKDSPVWVENPSRKTLYMREYNKRKREQSAPHNS